MNNLKGYCTFRYLCVSRNFFAVVVSSFHEFVKNKVVHDGRGRKGVLGEFEMKFEVLPGLYAII